MQRPITLSVSAMGITLTLYNTLNNQQTCCVPGIVLVSDAIGAMGLPDGTYQLGEQTVVVQGYEVYIKDTNILAGG